MTRIQAMKEFFEDLSAQEILDFKKGDPEGFIEIGDLAIAELTEQTEQS